MWDNSALMAAVGERFRFGRFEVDSVAGQFRRDGVRRRLQAQPLKLLVLLARRAGTLVTHEEIRAELWPEGTFVEFDQAVHFAIRQIREALADSADRPLYIETEPRRGYRFIAPVETIPTEGAAAVKASAPATGTTVRLQKALWANIAELRVAETRRQRSQRVLVAAMLVSLGALLGLATYILVTR